MRLQSSLSPDSGERLAKGLPILAGLAPDLPTKPLQSRTYRCCSGLPIAQRCFAAHGYFPAMNMIGTAQAYFVDPADLFPRFLRVSLNEVLNQHRNILLPLPQRRYTDRENIEPVKQVGSKRSRSDGCR